METQGPDAEPTLLSTGAGDDKLRELRDRAHAALAEQRRHMHELEQRLASQFENVASELAEELTSDQRDSIPSNLPSEQRDLLHRERADWQAEQELAEAQIQTQLEELRACEYELSQREQQIETRGRELDDREGELGERQAEVDAERLQLAAERESFAQERQQFDSLREDLEAEREEVKSREEQLAQREAELVAREEASAAELEEQRQHDVQAQEEALSELTAQAEQASHDAEELSRQVAELQQQLEAEGESAREWQEKYQQATSEWESQREKFVDERNKLSVAFRLTKQELDQARNAEPEEDYQELQQKFELAMADAHALRQQNAELELQLARRPEPDEAESIQLVELREERDALLARIEQLEQQASEGGGAGPSDEVADLQRRFEMAVQDVRELREENSRLKEQLEGQESTTGTSDGGALDWEAQKRRLLASLEGEEEDEYQADPARTEERTTIEGTIRITDEVIAEKDRQIAELEQQLREGGNAPPVEDVIAQQREELLDADETIRAEREKLAALEDQLNEALRKAELELSVERAKIARERSQIEELQEEINSLRRQQSAGGGAEKSRGRWLSKLGLGGDDSST